MHPERRAIETAIVGGASFRSVSHHYGLSEASVQRHWHSHVQPGFADFSPNSYETRPTDLLARLEEVADSARNARRHAEESGNLISAIRAGDAEIKAITAMGDRLGIRDTTILGHLNMMIAVVSAVTAVAREHPEVGEEILLKISHADEEARDVIAAQIAKGKQKQKSEIQKND